MKNTASKVKILIVEDETVLAQDMAYGLTQINYEILGVAPSVSGAIKLINQHDDIDVILIDITLKGNRDGIELAHIINSNYHIPFIFLTSHDDSEFTDRAKKAKPCAYLLKPFNIRQVSIAIEMAIEKFVDHMGAFSSQKPVNYNSYLFVKHGYSLYKICPDDIIYLEVEGAYCSLITEEKTFLLQISLAKIMEELPNNQFIKTHRNYIVNTKEIKIVSPKDNLIQLSNGNSVLLSRRYKEEFLKSYKVLK